MKCLCLLLCLLMLPLPALTEDITFITGTAVWPDEENPLFTYTYSLPHLTEGVPGSEGFNAFYDYTLDDALAFTVPILGKSLTAGGGKVDMLVTTEITCQTDRYLSVKVLTSRKDSTGTSTVCAAQVFARTGFREGLVESLPRLLHLLPEDKNDAWLEERQTQKVNDCISSMVWERVQEMELPLLPDASLDLLRGMFYPEEDFYLDAQETPVFFLQEGVLTDESQGILLIPIPMEDILDEL